MIKLLLVKPHLNLAITIIVREQRQLIENFFEGALVAEEKVSYIHNSSRIIGSLRTCSATFFCTESPG